MTLIALYRDLLRRFRKTFSVFLVFISAVDLFVGTAVCSGDAAMQFLCANGERHSQNTGIHWNQQFYSACDSHVSGSFHI